jgi:hypothetical protein
MQDNTVTLLRADDGGSATAIKQAMDDLRAKRITADGFRAIMRASREQNGEAGHDRLKFAAAAQATRLPGGGS